MALQFYLTTHALKNGEHAIRVSAHIANTRLQTTIGISVNPDFWLDAKQKVKKGAVNSEGMKFLISVCVYQLVLFVLRFQTSDRNHINSVLSTSICILSSCSQNHLECWTFHSSCVNLLFQCVEGCCPVLNQ